MSSFLHTFPVRPLWCVLLVLMTSSQTFSQANVYYQSEASTLKGYWRLVANPTTHTTIVQFFDGQNQPIYQETLPGHYLDLTKRTLRVLDDLLARLETNNLLDAQLKSQIVPFPQIDDRPKRMSFPENSANELDTTLFGGHERIHCSVNPEGSIRLNLLNPSAETMTILLIDEWGKALYKTSTYQEEYFSRLDVSNLPNGQFQLKILNQKGKEVYAYRLSKSSPTVYQVQSQSDLQLTSRTP